MRRIPPYNLTSYIWSISPPEKKGIAANDKKAHGNAVGIFFKPLKELLTLITKYYTKPKGYFIFSVIHHDLVN